MGDISNINEEKFGKSDSQWINTVLKKGTIADRLAAHTLLVHEAKNLNSLSTIIDMVDANKCRRECTMAMDTLKELFLDSLSSTSVDPQILKKIQFYYTKFIDRLEAVAFDNLATTRNKAINTMADLLVKHPDNKKYIMEKLVNKIGDKVPKIATHASHLIEQIINEKKQDLKEMALTEAERFLNRPKIEPKAQYYTLCLLNHLILSRKNPEIANRLLEIYLKYFSTQIKQGSVDSKLMGALLIGINRAYPFSKLKLEIFEQQLQVLYTIVHYVNYTMSVQALVLMHTILSRQSQAQKIPIEDRFYNTVYNHLLQPELQSCSKQQSLLSMVHALVSQDIVLERQKAFVKRLLQVAMFSPPSLSCSILLTVIKLINIKSSRAMPSTNADKTSNEDDSKLSEGKKGEANLKKKIYVAGKMSKKEQNELKLAKFIDADDDDEERYEDVPEIYDPVTTSKETKSSVDDIIARGEKRKKSQLMDHDRAKRALLMSAKLTGRYSEATKQLLETSSSDPTGELINDDRLGPINLDELAPRHDKISTSSWQHNNSRASQDENKDYDPLARNPKFCKAGKSKLWELCSLRKHYHPSVALFANKAISGEYYIYDGDALEDFSVKNFLDRFISRNPKKSLEFEANAKMQASGKKMVASHSSKCLFSRTLYKNNLLKKHTKHVDESNKNKVAYSEAV